MRQTKSQWKRTGGGENQIETRAEGRGAGGRVTQLRWAMIFAEQKRSSAVAVHGGLRAGSAR
jgi:hypothetical protein